MNKLLRLMPLEKSDRLGVGCTLLLLTLVTINDLNTLNSLYETRTTYCLTMFSFGLFILFSVLGNMYMAMRTNSTIDSISQLPSIMLAEWRYCSACELNAPPRAYHCFVCRKCILKRHNHCMFLGKCVGYKNHRFYLMFILYVWLGTVYSNILNVNYFISKFAWNELNFRKLFITFMPFFAWVLQMISLVELIFVFANAISLILSLMLIFYGGINFKMALNNQTWHESTKKIEIYKLNWQENLLDVFGKRWLFGILFPFASIELPSDGINFKKRLDSSSNNENDHQSVDLVYNNPYSQMTHRSGIGQIRIA
jgi:palmitoyltransferase